jgi:polysaccharide chain length determinant protein (PEP-CTERM system associated)
MSIHDYVEMLKRRVWLILISSVVFLGIGVALSHVISPRYVSQTLVLIEQQKVPEDYVKPVVSEDLGERLASMKEQILSRSRIEPIVDRFNLFAANNRTMDDRIDMTRKSIEILPIRSDQARGMPGFFISFKAQDARIAQQVCGEITSLFVSENLSDREQSAEGTTDFLKQQLADAKRNLDDQDAKLAEFQRKYIGKLPEQGPANTNTLQALTTELDAANQSLNRLQQDETFQQAMIAQQTHDLQRNEPAAAVVVDERKSQLKTLLAKKQELETLYTPDHPDVVAITRQISDLQAEMAAAPPPAPFSAPINRPDTPQLQQLKAQLRATQQAISTARLEQSRIQQQVGMYEGRIEASPTVEEEYKQITRDHDTALQFYNTLLTKMNESSMATALEHRQQGEQFKVMDAPNLPDAPTFPNPVVFAGGGLAFGLFLGLAIAALLEYRDKSLRNEKDIWAFTKLPTLAIISHVEGLPQPVFARRGWWPFSRMNKPVESMRG